MRRQGKFIKSTNRVVVRQPVGRETTAGKKLGDDTEGWDCAEVFVSLKGPFKLRFCGTYARL